MNGDDVEMGVSPSEEPGPRPIFRTFAKTSWILLVMSSIVAIATVFGGRSVEGSPSPPPDWIETSKNWLALSVLVVMMIGIATEVLHRTWCALIGASLMLGLLMWTKGYPSLETVVSWIDDSTVCVLFGMMIIVGRLVDTGVFEVMGGAIVRSSGGRMWVMVVYLMTAVAAVSAWLDNVTTMLIIAPVTIAVMKRCQRDPTSLLLALTFASNIGGAATMVGDPPALIIGTALSDYVGFVDFLANMAPGAVIAMIMATPLIVFVVFGGTLTGLIENYEDVAESTKEYCITDWSLLAKSFYVTFAVLLGFVLHPIHHIDPSWFALLGAIILCVSCLPLDAEKALHSVELDLLLFFAGLFVATEAAAEIGAIDMIAGWMESALESTPESARTIVSIQLFLWTSAISSAFLGAIPFTIAMVPIVERLGSAGLGLDIAIMAWSLNFGACFGGNATPIGSAAGVVVCGLSEKNGYKMGFRRWLPSGVIVTFFTVSVADIWLILRFCL